MIELQPIHQRWTELCVVAATGPSLTPEVAAACRGHHVVACKDAWQLYPDAEVLYACDRWWWEHYEGVPKFKGEKWSSHSERPGNRKIEVAEKYGVRLVAGDSAPGFSLERDRIHYGQNSGFQAVNMALHLTSGPIVLVGFDMRTTNKRHFFGPHPGRRPCANYERYIGNFEQAAQMLDGKREIINATPDSKLKGFPMARLEDALSRA